MDGGELVMGQKCGDCGGTVIRKEVWWVVLLHIQLMARKRAVVQPRS